MGTLLWSLLLLGGLISLAYHCVSLIVATVAVGLGLLLATFFSPFSWPCLILLWGLFIGLAILFHHPEYKRKFLFQPIFDAMRKALPPLSETEKIAIEAGTIGWDGELFSGRPEWKKLTTIPVPKLTPEEQSFLEGPVKELCEMINDWQITHQAGDLPPPVWEFLKQQGFFALIIPKRYGGKGFSELAHSEILAILAGRSLTLASTVAVPNSLGPAELLLRYGTQQQRDYFLPRLASGEEIPCFALTAPNAGSDAGAITDTGVICKGMYQDKEVIGINLNWNKRYITLAPIATLLGLAFKLYDPENLLGDKTELGITCALIPTHLPGITIGRRHLPSNIPFQNGPTSGKDVFVPLDAIIGGPNLAGQGWRMLVECLSTGRAISLPSSSAGCAKIAAFTSGAYSLIRRQFRTPLCGFEGIQEVLARIGGYTYLCEAIRYLTVAMIDMGEKPSVLGAIAKYHVTELGRKISNDAMDIHGGKGIMLGPKNYLARTYQGVPIGITVEGANILTRSMIIFGQGAIRCHPFLLKEMQALSNQHFHDFEHFFGEHCRFMLSNGARALFHGLSFAKLASSPYKNATKSYFQQLTRCSNAFAFVSDVALAYLGGKLKFKESLSARLGDLLAMMYMMSAVLKHHLDQNSPNEDFPLVQWSLDFCLAHFWQTMDAFLRNFPQPFIAFGLRIIVMPLGLPRFAPKDNLNKKITEILTTPSSARNRLLHHVFVSLNEKDAISALEKAFQATAQHAALIKRVYDAIKNNDIAAGSLKQSIDLALRAKILTDQEATALYEVDVLSQAVIGVDDFDPKEFNNLAQAQ